MPSTRSKIQKKIILVSHTRLLSSFPLHGRTNILLANYDSWWQHQMSVCELRHDRPSWRFSKSRGLSASVSFLSSPPLPRSFTCAIFRAVFDSCSSFFAPKPHRNACYASYVQVSLLEYWNHKARVRWVAFTKAYSQGKWLISHLPPTFAILYLLELFNFSCPRCGAYSRAALVWGRRLLE